MRSKRASLSSYRRREWEKMRASERKGKLARNGTMRLSIRVHHLLWKRGMIISPASFFLYKQLRSITFNHIIAFLQMSYLGKTSVLVHDGWKIECNGPIHHWFTHNIFGWFHNATASYNNLTTCALFGVDGRGSLQSFICSKQNSKSDKTSFDWQNLN